MIRPSTDWYGTSRKVESFLIGKTIHGWETKVFPMPRKNNKQTQPPPLMYKVESYRYREVLQRPVWYKPLRGIVSPMARYQVNRSPPTPHFRSIEFNPLRGPPFPTKYSWIPKSKGKMLRLSLERAHLRDAQCPPGKRTSFAILISPSVFDSAKCFTDIGTVT